VKVVVTALVTTVEAVEAEEVEAAVAVKTTVVMMVVASLMVSRISLVTAEEIWPAVHDSFSGAATLMGIVL